MNAETRELLARITRTVEDLSETEHLLNRQRLILREAATRLRTGEAASVVAARLDASRCWALGTAAVSR
jgi:hypothetical protein